MGERDTHIYGVSPPEYVKKPPPTIPLEVESSDVTSTTACARRNNTQLKLVCAE